MTTRTRLVDFRLFQHTSDPQRRCHFRLVVPVECQPTSGDMAATMTDRPFVPVARFAADDPNPIDLEISWSQLAMEVTPCDVARHDLQQQGWQVTGQTKLGTPGSDDFALVSERYSEGESWVRQTRVMRNANRVFRIDAVTKAACLSTTSQRLATAVASFRLLHPERRTNAASQVDQPRTALGPFSFNYPSSWQLHETRPPRTSCLLVNRVRGTLLGSITVAYAERQPNAPRFALLQEFVHQIQRQGIRITGSPILPVNPAKGFAAAHLFSPKATLNGQRIAVMGLLVEHERCQLIMAAMSPHHQTSSAAFMLNKRAFEIVRESLAV